MKRIITCSDGTWNKPGTTDRGKQVKTNVEKIFETVCAEDKDTVKGEIIRQVKVYDEGVGTGYTLADKIFGGMAGNGIDKNIKDVYTFICLNYIPGDELYLFGFSRGAYTARSIAGFIRNCGILRPQYIHLVDKAYDLYRDRNDYSLPDSDLMTSWRTQFCAENVSPITFIGVWDTVGSLGIPFPFYRSLNQKKYKFHDCTLSSYVKNAYHALAVDERRSLFVPTLWEESKNEDGITDQKMEQRWFPGVHSNIGGGYVDSGLSDRALEWILEKAKAVGLCFNEHYEQAIKANYKGEIRNSYTLKYWFWPPKCRKIDLIEKKYNQTIDESVRERYKALSDYRPPNLPL